MTSKTLRTSTDFAQAGISVPDADRIAERYAVAVTPTLAGLIDPTDSQDPIARQFIPDIRELSAGNDDLSDPIGDQTHSPVKGIVHRYPDRVLLTPLLHCPVYCRFCFRRERVGGEKALSESDLVRALDYISGHEEVWEVVITGGDPLMLPPARLASMLAGLEAIPHVRNIRIHSRIPVADPERITEEMVAALQLDRAALWIAVHSNHPRELTEAAAIALRCLSRGGIPLLGQTVLLKGVNDSAETLEALFRAMVANRIKPYYLHHPDLAPGTKHFRLPIEEGQAILRELRGRVSGVCQPTYILDIPGGVGKVPIGPSYYENGAVTDWRGETHRYRPT